MKLFSLIGALLLSTAPVQAFETFEELDKACRATEEITNICAGAGNFVAAGMAASLLCDLEGKGMLTTEDLFLSWDELNTMMNGNNGDPVWNAGVAQMLENFPECSIKP